MSELLLKCFVENKLKMVLETVFCVDWLIILRVDSLQMLYLNIGIICLQTAKL